MIRFRAILLAVVAIVAAETSTAQQPATTSNDTETGPAAVDQASLERDFQEMLAGTSLKGFFTELNQKSIDELLPDSYRIDKVIKKDDGYWFFDAKVQYRGHDIPFRMPVKVKWAGATPVITLDNLPAPGLGTFTARIMFFDGLYAGTWAGHNFRGHMYGEVVKQEAPEKEPTETPQNDSSSSSNGT